MKAAARSDWLRRASVALWMLVGIYAVWTAGTRFAWPAVSAAIAAGTRAVNNGLQEAVTAFNGIVDGIGLTKLRVSSYVVIDEATFGVGVLAVLGIAVIAVIGMSVALSRMRSDGGTIVGGARWRITLPKELRERDGLVLGQGLGNSGTRRLAITRWHTLICAPSGAGKGIGMVIPTLLSYRGSLLVVDPKGDLFRKTSRYRKSLGKVVVLRPFAEGDEVSSQINPLLALRGVDEAQASKLATALATSLVEDEQGQGQHFTDFARSLIQALCHHVALSNKPTFGEVRRIMSLPLAQLEEEVTRLGRSPVRSIAQAARSVMNAEPRERSGFFSTANRQLNFLDVGKTTWVLEGENEGVVLQDEVTTMYVVVPSAMISSQFRFIRLIVGAVIEKAMARSRRPEQPLGVLVDEFGQLGQFKDVERWLPIVRDYNIRLWLIVQDLSQLKARYAQWQTFLAGMTQVFFGTTDLDTQRYVSDSLGEQRVRYSSPRGRGDRGVDHRFERVPLASVHDIHVMGDRSVIVRVRGEPPVRLKRLSYFKDGRFRRRADG